MFQNLNRSMLLYYTACRGLPGGSDSRRPGFFPWVGKIPWRIPWTEERVVSRNELYRTEKLILSLFSLVRLSTTKTGSSFAFGLE